MSTDSRLLGGLDILAAVVESGSFVRAGRRLGLSQSGVSRAVLRLEERVGVRLFDRNARAVRLTDEGKTFHAQVAPLLRALEDAVDGASGAATRVRGKLRINADPFFASAVLASRLPELFAAHPELDLEIVTRDSAGNLIAEGFDLALRFGDPEATGLIAKRLLKTRIVTCASPAYLERHGRPRHPRDLANGHVGIHFYDPRTKRPFEWEFHQGRKRIRNVELQSRLMVNDGATAIAACVAGVGIAQPMEIGVRRLLREGVLVELFPAWHDEMFPLNVLYPSRFLPSAKVRAFVDFVTSIAREGAP
ncbi:Transcriptional regulator, LysR family protein [Minicystis rosea]|nr:Transcriptional regulator, LysR family protein [Minicystis rosea]